MFCGIVMTILKILQYIFQIKKDQKTKEIEIVMPGESIKYVNSSDTMIGS